MTASDESASFLVEIGTEELPPKALKKLMSAFAENLARLLTDSRLDHGRAHPFASPRRLAVIVDGLALAQADREVEAKGPPVNVAFDGDGKPKPAALAFARKCGVGVEDLQRTQTGKGEWLSYRSVEKGVAASALLPGIIEQALHALPIPRRMRWGSTDVEFVRPVHWVVMLHGTAIVDGNVMGHAAGNTTRGHRFLSDGAIRIDKPERYVSVLREEGFVLADFTERQQRIRDQVAAAAGDAGGTAAAGDDLYEEVAALTEWPVAMTGRFDEKFLALPAEAITASLTGHQRYFPLVDEAGALLPAFVVVANLESRDPDKVRDGNERVIRPRLADAAFFWQNDCKTPLRDRLDTLDKVVYQKGLGSVRDKSVRVEKLSRLLAGRLDGDADSVARAAMLAKCDLVTGMVGEFPELQGVMGGYYALADGETETIAAAIREQYLPKFAGDLLPATAAGQTLALAEKLDTLAGVFAIGKRPSGNKDPFGLRRAALGIVRILIECRLELGLREIIEAAVALQPVGNLEQSEIAAQVQAFVVDRLRSFYVDRPDVTAEIFDAVLQLRDKGYEGDMPLPDFDRRIRAVQAFVQMSESSSLAAANKRISNILQQSGGGADSGLDKSLLQESAEIDLSAELDRALADVGPLSENREYAAVLARLAELRRPVDRFFDEVMVMTDDEDLKRNRLALLARLREPFHSVADISRLTAGKPQSE